MSSRQLRSLQIIGSGLVAFLLVAAIVVAVNVILRNMVVRRDLTEEKIYTLSQGTRAFLAQLQQPVTLKFFFSESDPRVPVMLKNFAHRVNDLLAEYAEAAQGRVIIEHYDPEPDSDAEDWAKRYGLAGQALGFMGPTIYIGLVAVAGSTEAAMPVVDPQSENLLEYNITRLVARVGNPAKPKIGILSSLPVLGAPPSQYAPMMQPPTPWMAFKELREEYELELLPGTLESVPAGIDAVILVHPKDLTPGTLYALDQFVLRGGRLIAFLDPLCVTEMETANSPDMRMAPKSSSIPELLAAWGVEFSADQVVADMDAATPLRAPQGGRYEENPLWLSLRKDNLASRDVLTANLETLLMVYAGGFTAGTNAAGVSITPLMTTSTNTGDISAMMAQGAADAVRQSLNTTDRRYDLAVRIHGKLATAFPDGKPPRAADAATPPPEEPPDTAPALKESVAPSTIILVGDVDMLNDRFCVRGMNFLGFTTYQPMNDNLALFLNSVEQAAGNVALMDIRSRGKSERPFEVVVGLQRQAQERYLAEEKALQDKLTATQERLNELQSQKGQGQQSILSPEQKQEIEMFRQQEYETKQQLKQVRRELRADIERLGVRVKVINVLVVPAAVVAVGIGFAMYRRSKTRQGFTPPAGAAKA